MEVSGHGFILSAGQYEKYIAQSDFILINFYGVLKNPISALRAIYQNFKYI